MSGWDVWVWLVVVWAVWVGAADNIDDPPVYEEYPGLALDYPENLDYNQDYALDYLYHGGEYFLFEPHLPNVTLHKCHCEGDQVWDGQGCQKTPHGTIVAILDLASEQRVVANTSNLGSVIVAPLTCPLGHRKVKLDSNLDHSFSLLETGDLYWQDEVFWNDLYCIDHTLDPTGQPTSWSAEVCLRPPPIPRCCSQSHILTSDGACLPSSSAPSLTPPINVLGKVLVWTNETEEGPLFPIACNKSDGEMHQLVIGSDIDSDVTLVWHYHGPMLHWKPPSVQGLPEQRTDYCLGVLEEGTTVARICYKDPVAEHRRKCRGSTCVRKCCTRNHLFIDAKCTHVDSEAHEWQPRFYGQPGSEVTAAPPTDLIIVIGLPLCKDYFSLEPHERYYLLPDGTLHINNFSKQFTPDSYCLENFLTKDGLHALPVVCFADDYCKTIQERMYPVLLAISCIFLAITLLVYVTVPELHAKVHGKCLVSHVTALLLAYLGLIIIQRTPGNLSDIWCKIMASVTHVSFLAAFFWLNVMCFDIWWTLKSMRPVAETGERSRLRFKMYAAYSWGCPALITLVAIIVQLLPEEYNVIRPDFGETKCWFDNKKSLWAYFYGFVLVLVVMNIVFFCWVAYILIMAQNDPILQRTRQQNRERMWLYVKLFLVMGLTWITEVISWQEGSCAAWIATDIINALQGFSIFLIFICKKNMIKRIHTNWDPYLRRVKEIFGPSRRPPSNRKVVRDTSSFSSSVNRPSQSNASQRTVQSQISLDPTTASRKLSTTSFGSLVGAPLHASNSLPMTTITEATNQEGAEDTELGTSGEENDSERQRQKAGAQGNVRIDLENEGGEEEDIERQSNEKQKQGKVKFELGAEGQENEEVERQNAEDERQNVKAGRQNEDAERQNIERQKWEDRGHNAECERQSEEQNEKDERQKGQDGRQNEINDEPLVLDLPGIHEAHHREGSLIQRPPRKSKVKERGKLTDRVEKDVKGMEEMNGMKEDGQEGIFNRSFTTEHDDDQPVEL